MKLHLSFSKKLTYLLIICFLIFNNSSFGQIYYVPSDAHLLNLNQRNDIHFSIGSSPHLESKKIANLQLAYSPIKYLGISTSHFNYTYLENTPTVPKETINKNWNVAIGGYFFLPLVESMEFKTNINEKNKFFSDQNLSQKSGVLFDLYLGYSEGNIRNNYEKYGSSRFSYTKSYIQVGIHTTVKYFGFQFATRRGILNYVDAVFQGNSSPYVRSALIALDSDNDMVFTEQFIRLYGGIKYGQIIFSFSRIKHNETFFELGVKNHLTTLGLQLDIDEIFRKKK